MKSTISLRWLLTAAFTLPGAAAWAAEAGKVDTDAASR